MQLITKKLATDVIKCNQSNVLRQLQAHFPSVIIKMQYINQVDKTISKNLSLNKRR